MEPETLRGTFAQFEVWQFDEDGNTHRRAVTRYLETAQAAAKDWAKSSPSGTAYIYYNSPIHILIQDKLGTVHH